MTSRNDETSPPAPREGVELPSPPDPAPAADAPGALTLEGLSVNPDPAEVASGRALDAAHTDHDDISDKRPGLSPDRTSPS